jgi:penicillin-binding protein 2
VRQKANIQPENLARVNDALYGVVNEEKGTAYPVRDRTLEVAGKTGTAQTGYVNPGNDDPKKAWYLSRDHAWFAAYSPAKAPEISVVVLVEHGGSGPTVAAPVAMQVVKEYHRLQANRAAKGAKPTKETPAPKASAAPANTRVEDATPRREPPPPDPNALPPSVPTTPPPAEPDDDHEKDKEK